MIRWSTPTQPITVRGCDLTQMERVTVTFAQGCRRVDIDDPPMSYDAETGCTELLPTLSQLQTAGFCPGTVEVQVNAIDWMGYRVASDKERFHMGSNILDRRMNNAE